MGSLQPPDDQIKIDHHPIYSRLRICPYRCLRESQFMNLNCYDAYMEDANLSIHNDIGEPEDEEINNINLDVFKDPCVTSAIVEYVDTGAMKRIINECYDQSDYERLRRIHVKEFKRAAREISIEIDYTTLSDIWTGCLSAAKAISTVNYWTGPISPWFRFNLFKYIIFPKCTVNSVYKFGALSAIHFKAWRQEPISLDGVPLKTFSDPDFNRWKHYESVLYS